MRTRSSSQGGGDTTACASSSAGGVSGGKRRKTASHEDQDAPANRPGGPNDAEAEAPASTDEAERQLQPAVSAGPATAELQGVPAPDPGINSSPYQAISSVCCLCKVPQHVHDRLLEVYKKIVHKCTVTLDLGIQVQRWTSQRPSRSGACSSRNTHRHVNHKR